MARQLAGWALNGQEMGERSDKSRNEMRIQVKKKAKTEKKPTIRTG